MSAALKLNLETQQLSEKPRLGKKVAKLRLVWENPKLSAETQKGKSEVKPDASYGRGLYNYHRYYDPATGRYITSDPIGLGGGLNPFLYAYANPLLGIDPSGLVCQTISFPINFHYGSDTKWEKWGKWSLDFVNIMGGDKGQPFLIVRCICKRYRPGKRTTKFDIIWQHVKVCSSCGVPSTSEWKTTENVYTDEKSVKDKDSKIIWGGYAGNETSAYFECERRCDQLNQL